MRNIEHRTSNGEHPMSFVGDLYFPRPATKRGEGQGEGKLGKRTTSPRPSPPFHGGEGEPLTALVAICSLCLKKCRALLFLAAYSIRAQTNSDDDAPRLLPPYGEVPPSFWEQHGVAVGWSIVAVVSVIGVLVALRLRHRPAVVIPPEVQARRALNELAARPEDGRVLSDVSQILRRYFVGAFQLPADEATTSEFCRVLAADERVGTELSTAVADFLRRCDVRKFSPAADTAPIGAVSQALDLIDKAEARRVASAQTSSATRA